MSVDALPSPLTPPDCDLRGFPWMALDTVRLIDSDTFILSTGDEFKAALALWCKSWSQVPAGSLPTDERLLTGLSGAKNWKKVRDVALRNWVLCSDGRYYHPIVCEKAMEALPARKAHAEKKVADAERKERERADRKRLFELLRENGITPDFHTTTTKLREIAAPIIDRMKSQDVTRDKSHEVTAKKEQDRTEEDKTGQERTGPVLEDSVPDGTDGQAVGAAKQDAENDPGMPDETIAQKLERHVAAAAAQPVNAGEKRIRADETIIWNGALALLMIAGKGEKAARAFLGKQLSEHDRSLAIDVFHAVCIERPVETLAWITAAIQVRKGERAAKNKYQSQADIRADHIADMVGDTPGKNDEKHKPSPRHNDDAIDVSSRVVDNLAPGA